jgi:hypothetical protein
MTKRKNALLAALLCAAGFASAGAVALELDRPVAHAPHITLPGVETSATDVEKAALPDVRPDTIVLPPITILAVAPPPVAAPPGMHPSQEVLHVR